jgi:hypothetical protein
MPESATARASELIATAPNRCPLTEEQKTEIRRIAAAADARVAL